MKRLYWITCWLLALSVIGWLYLQAGLADAAVHVDYTVSITEPASGRARVSMTIDPGKRLFLDLYMRDSMLNGSSRVENLAVTRDGRPVPSWPTFPGYRDLTRIWTMGSGLLTVEYDVNPLWLKGNSPRSYLGEHFAYLRGMALLYTPITRQDLPSPLGSESGKGRGLATAALRFSLPEGWQINSPWPNGESVRAATLRNVYFGLGRLSLQTITAGEAEMQLAIYTGLAEDIRVESQRALPEAFLLTREMMQVDPLSDAPVWTVSVLPSDPLNGGAAGTNSLIASPDLGTLVHEMFHWWNGHTVGYAKDANWIHEGFTTYYEGKLLRQSGYWSESQLNEYLGRTYHQTPNVLTPLNLPQASASFLKRYSQDGYYQVYSGGASVAAWLDRELQQMGRSLDEIWPQLLRQTDPITTETFLEAVSDLYGSEIAAQCRSIVLGQQPIPAP